MASEGERWRGLGRWGASLLLVTLCACGNGAGAGAGGKGQGKARAAADSTRAQPPAEAQACRLIAMAEVSTITGLELKPGEKNADYLGYSRCQWDPTAGKPTGIVLVLNSSGKFSDYSTVPGAMPLKGGGLGLEAVWNPTVHQLAVRRDTGTLSVSFLSEPAQKSWADKIARTVLDRLEKP